MTNAKIKQARNRNPAFPAISLQMAISRAYVLNNHEPRKLMAAETAARHWGYSVKSSGAQQVLSALKQYGLLTEEMVGKFRKVKLSDLAHKIILDKREGSVEKLESIRRAALMPKIYAELWKLAGDNCILPSDSELQHHLTVDRSPPFYMPVIKGLIKDFRSTISLAKLETSDIIDGNDLENDEKAERDPFLGGLQGLFGINNPLGSTKQAQDETKKELFSLDEGHITVQWPASISSESFDDIKDWLEILERKIGRCVRSSDDS